jgi:hypothetical protein
VVVLFRVVTILLLTVPPSARAYFRRGADRWREAAVG